MQISANHCKSRLRKIIEKTTLICRRWRVRPGQQAGGTESAFFGKLDVLLLYLTCAFSPFCHVVVCKLVCWACLLMLLLMLLLPGTSSYFLLFPTTSSHSCYFLLFPFAYFSWFQPGRPVPPQTARFYVHSFNLEGY